MKILQINSVCGYGSTGKIVVDIYKAVEESGNQCYIAYGRHFTQSTLKTIRIGSRIGVLTHAAISRFTDKAGFYSRNATHRLIDQISRLKPDVIHLHNIHGYYINVDILFKYLGAIKTPVIWTLHDCWSFTGHCAYFPGSICNEWQSGCCTCTHSKEYPKSILQDYSRRNYINKKSLFTKLGNITLVVPSKWLKKIVSLSFMNEHRIYVIPNGIDLKEYNQGKGHFRAMYKLEGKIILLGVANNWTERKGLYIFNELASILDDRFVIVLVGIDRGMEKKLNSKIVSISRISDQQVLSQMYSEADIFINASSQETQGMVSVEALACGTKVVTNCFTANPEVVDETCGVIVSTITVSSYYEAINTIMNMNISRDDCLKVARKYDSIIQYTKYIDLYKSVLEESIHQQESSDMERSMSECYK